MKKTTIDIKKKIYKSRPLQIITIVLVCLFFLVIYDYFSPDNVMSNISLIFRSVLFGGLIGLLIYALSFLFFKPKKEMQCPKCDSTNIKIVKPSLWSKSSFAGIAVLAGAGKQPKNLNVCRNCGFSWEDR